MGGAARGLGESASLSSDQSFNSNLFCVRLGIVGCVPNYWAKGENFTGSLRHGNFGWIPKCYFLFSLNRKGGTLIIVDWFSSNQTKWAIFSICRLSNTMIFVDGSGRIAKHSMVREVRGGQDM